MPVDRVMHRLKLRELRILLAVTQTGSMAKAATQLAISQPAVSRAIADMEASLGVSLLDRNPRGVEPTQYGRALLKRSVAVFDELRQGVQDIEFLSDPTAGEVRIGSIPPLAASFVPAVIDRLSRRHPRIVFHLMTTQLDSLHRELSERNVDLLITRRSGRFADEHFSFETLYDDPYAVVAGAQNPWARRRKIELAELVSERWVLPPPESLLGSDFMEAFRAGGLDYPRATVVTFPIEARISLLATGRFLTIFSSSVLRFPTRRPEIKVLPVEMPKAHVPNGIVTLKGRTLSPVAQLFIEHARELAKSMARGE
jgi:DNA-binding transcriptional LysR family regulator